MIAKESAVVPSSGAFIEDDEKRSARASVSTEGLQIHTLGPTGTNCEAAAQHWLKAQGGVGAVVLHETLEDAVVQVLSDPRGSALLGCVVYPRLNEIVFQNLDSLYLYECFVMPTHSMVLAAATDRPISSVVSHPAPVNLLDGRDVRITLANSNTEAAMQCAAGAADACITTIVGAKANGLLVLEDFGPVPMGFSVHLPKVNA